MHISLRFFLFILIVSSLYNCDLFNREDVEPDLRFKEWENIINPCSGYSEFLDTRNLYWVPVAGTINNWVLLYWRTGLNGYGFFDCFGQPWYIIPGSNTTIISYRYFENYQENGTSAETANEPAAQSYTTVIAPDGTSETTDGPIITFGSMSGGDVEELPTTIHISQYGTYVNEYVADPLQEIKERNESNNSLLDVNVNFEGKAAEGFSFEIIPLAGIKNIKKPYAIYNNGQIEWVDD